MRHRVVFQLIFINSATCYAKTLLHILSHSCVNILSRCICKVLTCNSVLFCLLVFAAGVNAIVIFFKTTYKQKKQRKLIQKRINLDLQRPRKHQINQRTLYQQQRFNGMQQYCQFPGIVVTKVSRFQNGRFQKTGLPSKTCFFQPQ